ncbi:uncharacterized protein MONBRDRAFT_11024 [Monosiga brevicollis MX1]|uniref:Uncharacterized protein n=1 Tax=Monosiga brevicollis TaxID=81824 RepID=A9V800_MONBE|nr:uncharacterized protein MONBRDRAFT_11024 [Monosiga brevicollis MX1]EDQ86464.1 predicted protein [Monosiga brevicollis MX1]|eukprot:XP_001748854.1 hypothetical protein [Monosiga brevicollis MX1]
MAAARTSTFRPVDREADEDEDSQTTELQINELLASLNKAFEAHGTEDHATAQSICATIVTTLDRSDAKSGSMLRKVRLDCQQYEGALDALILALDLMETPGFPLRPQIIIPGSWWRVQPTNYPKMNWQPTPLTSLVTDLKNANPSASVCLTLPSTPMEEDAEQSQEDESSDGNPDSSAGPQTRSERQDAAPLASNNVSCTSLTGSETMAVDGDPTSASQATEVSEASSSQDLAHSQEATQPTDQESTQPLDASSIPSVTSSIMQPSTNADPKPASDLERPSAKKPRLTRARSRQHRSIEPNNAPEALTRSASSQGTAGQLGRAIDGRAAWLAGGVYTANTALWLDHYHFARALLALRRLKKHESKHPLGRSGSRAEQAAALADAITTLANPQAPEVPLDNSTPAPPSDAIVIELSEVLHRGLYELDLLRQSQEQNSATRRRPYCINECDITIGSTKQLQTTLHAARHFFVGVAAERAGHYEEVLDRLSFLPTLEPNALPVQDLTNCVRYLRSWCKRRQALTEERQLAAEAVAALPASEPAVPEANQANDTQRSAGGLNSNDATPGVASPLARAGQSPSTVELMDTTSGDCSSDTTEKQQALAAIEKRLADWVAEYGDKGWRVFRLWLQTLALRPISAYALDFLRDINDFASRALHVVLKPLGDLLTRCREDQKYRASGRQEKPTRHKIATSMASLTFTLVHHVHNQVKQHGSSWNCDALGTVAVEPDLLALAQWLLHALLYLRVTIKENLDFLQVAQNYACALFVTQAAGPSVGLPTLSVTPAAFLADYYRSVRKLDLCSTSAEACHDPVAAPFAPQLLYHTHVIHFPDSFSYADIVHPIVCRGLDAVVKELIPRDASGWLLLRTLFDTAFEALPPNDAEAIMREAICPRPTVAELPNALVVTECRRARASGWSGELLRLYFSQKCDLIMVDEDEIAQDGPSFEDLALTAIYYDAGSSDSWCRFGKFHKEHASEWWNQDKLELDMERPQIADWLNRALVSFHMASLTPDSNDYVCWVGQEMGYICYLLGRLEEQMRGICTPFLHACEVTLERTPMEDAVWTQPLRVIHEMLSLLRALLGQVKSYYRATLHIVYLEVLKNVVSKQPDAIAQEFTDELASKNLEKALYAYFPMKNKNQFCDIYKWCDGNTDRLEEIMQPRTYHEVCSKLLTIYVQALCATLRDAVACLDEERPDDGVAEIESEYLDRLNRVLNVAEVLKTANTAPNFEAMASDEARRELKDALMLAADHLISVFPRLTKTQLPRTANDVSNHEKELDKHLALARRLRALDALNESPAMEAAETQLRARVLECRTLIPELRKGEEKVTLGWRRGPRPSAESPAPTSPANASPNEVASTEMDTA